MKYRDFESIQLSKTQLGKLFNVEREWVDWQLHFGKFPLPNVVAGKHVWKAMTVYHWWSEIYLEPEHCDDAHGRHCTATFDQMISDLFND